MLIRRAAKASIGLAMSPLVLAIYLLVAIRVWLTTVRLIARELVAAIRA